MLENGKWANHYDCCIECGTTEKKHCGKGICRKCLDVKRRKYKKGIWARNFDKCINCETTKRRHWAKGMCSKCYGKKRIRIKHYNDGFWSKKYNKCIECGTTETGHRGKGLCANCWARKDYKKNKKKWRDRAKKWRKNNPEAYKRSSKKYRMENVEKVRESKRICTQKRIKNDIVFKFRRGISIRIQKSLKRRLSSKNGKPTWDFLPYTVDDLIQHLEKLFIRGMTWENYGFYGWHIDHVRPDCSFNYKSVDDEEFQKCWALENLQPLWAVDNLKKGGKWEQ